MFPITSKSHGIRLFFNQFPMSNCCIYSKGEIPTVPKHHHGHLRVYTSLPMPPPPQENKSSLRNHKPPWSLDTYLVRPHVFWWKYSDLTQPGTPNSGLIRVQLDFPCYFREISIAWWFIFVLIWPDVLGSGGLGVLGWAPLGIPHGNHQLSRWVANLHGYWTKVSVDGRSSWMPTSHGKERVSRDKGTNKTERRGVVTCGNPIFRCFRWFVTVVYYIFHV